MRALAIAFCFCAELTRNKHAEGLGCCAPDLSCLSTTLRPARQPGYLWEVVHNQEKYRQMADRWSRRRGTIAGPRTWDVGGYSSNVGAPHRPFPFPSVPSTSAACHQLHPLSAQDRHSHRDQAAAAQRIELAERHKKHPQGPPSLARIPSLAPSTPTRSRHLPLVTPPSAHLSALFPLHSAPSAKSPSSEGFYLMRTSKRSLLARRCEEESA